MFFPFVYHVVWHGVWHVVWRVVWCTMWHVVQWAAPDSLKVIKVWYLQTHCLRQWGSDSVIKVKLSIITRSSPLFRNPPICQLRWKSGKRTMKIFPLKNVLQLREIQPSVFRQVRAIHMIVTILLTKPVGSVLVNALFLLRGVSNCWAVYNEWETLEWPRDAPHSSWDELQAGIWGHLQNISRLGQVTEPGFVLTGFLELVSRFYAIINFEHGN